MNMNVKTENGNVRAATLTVREKMNVLCIDLDDGSVRILPKCVLSTFSRNCTKGLVIP